MSEWNQSRAVDSDYGIAGPVRSLWPRLLAGDVRVGGWAYSPSGWFLSVVLRAPRERSAVTGRGRHFLEAAILGCSHKSIAVEHGVAESTVSTAVQQALARFGVRARASKAPPMLTVLARAAAALPVPRVRFDALTETQGIVSLLRPELYLRPHLPPAEFEVLLRIVEGQSYADVARERHVSKRTVANQVASIFHRLRVSGRAGLVSHVVSAAATGLCAAREEATEFTKILFPTHDSQGTYVVPPLLGSFPFLGSGRGAHTHAS